MTPARLLVPLLATAALAACGGEAETGPERRSAAGEVLGGTISDDMLPLDTVRSQSPPLRETGGDGGEREAPAEDGRATTAAPAATGAPIPAATAEPADPAPVETPEDG